MSNHTDDEFDALLRREGPAYRVPPPPPLDAMWARIDQAHFGAAEPAARPPMLPPSRRQSRTHWRTWLAAAASVLVGVGIGRATAPPGIVANPTPAQAVATSAPATPAARPATETVVLPAARAESVARLRRSTWVAASPGADPAALAPAADVAAPTAPLVSDGRGNAYEAATSRYLGQTAALLVSLPAELRAGRADQRFVAQAGDLLTTTRLLLDSDAAANQNVRRLLEDLELVLAQISRLPAARGAADLDLITQALEERDVVPRLRSAAADISTLED